MYTRSGFIVCLLMISSSLFSQYTGGFNDGHAMASVADINLALQDALYNGGTGQGYSSFLRLNRSIGTTDSTFNGGEGHGSHQYKFSNATLSSTDSLFNGNSGRGESVNGKVLNLSVCGNTSTWTGNTSTDWHNPANWDCAAVPGIYSIVVIPAGLPRYPIISYSTEIKQLQLKSGSMVSVNPTVLLILNGQ